jgi:hypothetical protein
MVDIGPHSIPRIDLKKRNQHWQQFSIMKAVEFTYLEAIHSGNFRMRSLTANLLTSPLQHFEETTKTKTVTHN